MKKKLISAITATIFLVSMLTMALPGRVSASGFTAPPIYIGIVGPKGGIQWDGLWEGATIAADMINKEGPFAPGGSEYSWVAGGPAGLLTPSGYAEVKLVAIDEHSVPTPDPSAAIAELTAALSTYPTMAFMIGGFRTECCAPMESYLKGYFATNHRPIWEIAGAATDSLISVVQSDYNDYKFIFRITPLASSVMAETLAWFIKQVVVPEMVQLYSHGNPAMYATWSTNPSNPTGPRLVPTYIICDALSWTDPMVSFFEDAPHGTVSIVPAGAQPTNYWGIKILGVDEANPVGTDFTTDIKTTMAGAKLVIQIFSTTGGAVFDKQYGEYHPDFALVGINVEAELQEFYASVSGACAYETILGAAATQTNLPETMAANPNAKPLTTVDFWKVFEDLYGTSPIYTAWASYDGIIALNETAFDSNTNMGWTNYITPPSAWSSSGVLNTTASNALITGVETLGLSYNPPSGPNHNWGRVYVPATSITPAMWYRQGMVGYFAYSGPGSTGGNASGINEGGWHDVYTDVYSFLPLDNHVGRAMPMQWQPNPAAPTTSGSMVIVWPQNDTFSRKWIIPPWMYPLETDIAGGTPANTTISATWPIQSPPYLNYTEPDSSVGTADMGQVSAYWYTTPAFNQLSYVMYPWHTTINIYDLARVAMDWGKSAVPK